MAVKTKLLKSKRSNSKKNKFIKRGIQTKKLKTSKSSQVIPVTSVPQHGESSEESDNGEDMLQMVDEDDIQFLKEAIANRSYSILNKVRYSGQLAKLKKRKLNNDDTLENKYEEQITDSNANKRIKSLLPIKTRTGIIPQQIVEEVQDEEAKLTDDEAEDSKNTTDATDYPEEYTLEDSGIDLSKPIPATQLLAIRNEALRQKKIHIGTLSSGLLENPEEKIMNLKTLLSIMDEETPEIYFTVRKLVIVSLLEVFKDILPSYEIKHVSNAGVKLKKDTLKLQKFEDTLLLYYKKFLQKLEKYSFQLIRRKGDSRKSSEEENKLSILAIQAMCDLLVAHPYFNFAQNIAQAIVPFLNSHNKTVRETVNASVKAVIKEDKKEEITLKILRSINNYLKNHAHIYEDILDVLLVLNLKDVNLDRKKEQDLKQKKLRSHKARIIQMSKKERKNSNNTKVLGVCLEGLAKFAHCINLDFYVDLVNVLDNLLKEDWLGYREQLHCVQTVFAILSGQGEALNIDPSRFYNNLYKYLLTTGATKKSDHILVLLKTLDSALLKRRKKITNKRTIGFVKRLATLSLQLLHNESLGCLGVIRNIMQLNRSVDILLDLDASVGEGKFQAEIDDPEYSNASSTALYEMVLLTRHYHPIVNKFARNIASGAIASGEGSLPGEYGKLSPEQLYTEFDMTQMVFNPAVPVVKQVKSKSKPTTIRLLDNSFEDYCKQTLKPTKKSRCELDFFI
ncbi:hypothetical protein NQ315_006766 [Exocentrus adspersus]|uniref:NOC3-like protein n=1 Tax=Exocentrus adspersus TaxID=1586481 RepID=A0AAV8WD80_9CUCU|nr:hypothetical protein NQ315_006766 [Exocentrus adspersus]